MKKILLIVFMILLISCNDKEDPVSESSVTKGLKKRVIYEEDYNEDRDSIIEYYDNKLIIRKNYYWISERNNKVTATYSSYDYNQNKMLTEISFFNDENLTNLYATWNYVYDNQLRIKSIQQDRFKSSNSSDVLYNRTYSFEYLSDTVNIYRINHQEDDKIDITDTYVIKGDMEMIIDLDLEYQLPAMTLFDGQKDPYLTKSLVDTKDPLAFEAEYMYGNTRISLINNIFGNRINSFLLHNFSPIRFYDIELRHKYTELILTHWMGDRGRYPEFHYDRFEYIFDAENLPVEMHYRSQVVKYFLN